MASIKIDSKTSELESGVVCNQFDRALAELKDNGFEIISLPQNAELRIKEGEDSHVSANGNYIREAGISIPKKGIYLVRNSPLLQLELAKEAVKAHRARHQYPIETDLAKEYEDKASQDANSEVFHLTNLEAISTKNFDKDKRALWLFQDKAENYGKFLYDSGITEMPLWFYDEMYINNQKAPFINQLWLRGLGDGSGLLGVYGDLGGGDGVRGVRKISGEASAQNSQEQKSELYTPKQITLALKRLKLSGLEQSILDDLRKHS